MSRPLQTWTGSCHCGAIRFEIDTDFPELTQCDCSICRRKNALMVKVHESAFRLLAGAEALADYPFHTHTAHHHFCMICGIYPFHLIVQIARIAMLPQNWPAVGSQAA